MSKIFPKAVMFVLIIIFERSESSSNFCGPSVYREPKGVIRTDPEFPATICSWTIKTPRDTVINVHLDKRNMGSCFRFKSTENDTTYYSLCNQTDISVTMPVNATVVVSHPGNALVSLFYTSYVIRCPREDFKCTNRSGDVCLGLYSCKEVCGPRKVPCGNRCYDVDAQRCDGALHCERGEDELGCNWQYCPDSIRCGQTSTCLKPSEICDGIKHCPGGNDERNCRSGRDKVTFVLFLGFSVLIVVFLCILCQCTGRRRRMRDLLENPLDAALPPFQGPGENESSDSGLPFFSDGDFKTEGPVYEAYAQVFEDKRYNGTSSTFRRTEGVLCVSENDAINEELAAIATLKLTTDQCVGMRETKSNPISKILFWDDCDESENACKVGNNSKPRPFKSDTDYYNKHIKDTTFV